MSTLPPSPSATDPSFRHYVLVLDCSTSMRRHLPALRLAANELIDGLRPLPGLMSIVLFNRDVERLCWREPLAKTPRLTEFNIPCDKGTALYDAISGTLSALFHEHNASRGENNTDVAMTIFTDGYDGHSQRFTRMGTRRMIGAAREIGWQVLFIGSSVPGLAEDLGIPEEDSLEICFETGAPSFRDISHRLEENKGDRAPDEEPGPAEERVDPAPG